MENVQIRFPLRTATASSFYATQNFHRNLATAADSLAFSDRLEFGVVSELISMEAEEGDDERGINCGEGAVQSNPSSSFHQVQCFSVAEIQSPFRSRRVRGVGPGFPLYEVTFDQHTFGDLVRAFLDSGLPSEAMDIYNEMRSSPDPPLSFPFGVMLKGLIPYPELREKVEGDFLELFPDMIVYDPSEDRWRKK